MKNNQKQTYRKDKGSFKIRILDAIRNSITPKSVAESTLFLLFGIAIILITFLDPFFFNESFFDKLFLIIVLLILIYIFISEKIIKIPNRKLVLSITAISILLNLCINRLVIELGQIILNNNDGLIALLPNLLPIALAPIIISVLSGLIPAILAAFIISILFSLSNGNVIDYFLITFLTGLVGSLTANKISNRSKLIKAGLFSGLASALSYIALSILFSSPIPLISQQIICSLLIGFLTGILAVGLLPIFEQIFKISTNITLLELTDYNHPLLRKMQFEAPGTYHHSLMVANLSENAAATISANPLLCRTCCLFHDVGKLIKPEYFSENQKGLNPHEEKNPSMSALVIKSHIKEGIEIAKKEKLPEIIIDVIKQHHGTSLIKYFYHQAKIKESKKEDQDNDLDKELINESNYRYDGPKPMFKESAIIFFADAVEAASRSLKKISKNSIDELIESIFDDRIKDGQLERCPLTFQELSLIKNSFSHTLLNMLHSRVSYPKE